MWDPQDPLVPLDLLVNRYASLVLTLFTLHHVPSNVACVVATPCDNGGRGQGVWCGVCMNTVQALCVQGLYNDGHVRNN